MSGEEIDYIKEVKNSFVKWVGTAFGLGIIGATAFYFNTISTQKEQSREIEEIRSMVLKNSTKIDDNVSKAEWIEYKQIVREDMASLHADIKEVRDDNKKILEILSEKTR
jgi:predicted metal-dependent phosphotriesterase family hydrolase